MDDQYNKLTDHCDKLVSYWNRMRYYCILFFCALAIFVFIYFIFYRKEMQIFFWKRLNSFQKQPLPKVKLKLQTKNTIPYWLKIRNWITGSQYSKGLVSYLATQRNIAFFCSYCVLRSLRKFMLIANSQNFSLGFIHTFHPFVRRYNLFYLFHLAIEMFHSYCSYKFIIFYL